MKVFIVFGAFFMVFSMLLVFNSDMDKYVQDQRLLKMLAEDCSEAGALTFDMKTKSIDAGKAFEAAQEILSLSDLLPGRETEIEEYEVTENGRGFRITLCSRGEDCFRLPFINIYEIRRASEYVWE